MILMFVLVRWPSILPAAESVNFDPVGYAYKSSITES